MSFPSASIRLQHVQLCLQDPTAVSVRNDCSERHVRVHSFAGSPAATDLRCQHVHSKVSPSPAMHLRIRLEQHCVQLRSKPSIQVRVDSSRIRPQQVRLCLPKTRELPVRDVPSQRHLRMHSFPAVSQPHCFQQHDLLMPMPGNSTLRLWLQVQRGHLQLPAGPCCPLPL